MSRHDSKKALSIRPPSHDYEVGYGKPPVQSRFQAGHSGNPTGRPKGSRKKVTVPALNEERLKSIILEEAYRSISINDPKGQISIPMVQAIVRSLAVNAAKGNQRSQRLFTQLLGATERDNKRLHDEWLQTAIEYKVEWDKELDRRKRLGINNAPAPLPHPDHVIIDMVTGGVRIAGPMTREDKIRWDSLRERKVEADKEIAENERLLQEKPNYRYRKQVLEEIEHDKTIRNLIARAIPD